MKHPWRSGLDTTTCAAALCSAMALASGCATIRVVVPRVDIAPLARGEFHAGAARVDITPVPGYPMGGHSLEGRIARGYWSRLYSRAIYLEDAKGRAIVLASADLWSMPSGLASRVAALLATDERLIARLGARRLAREQILIAATHTHHSPAAFSTDAFFAAFGSPKPGFDPDLFEFLALRIAESIVQAVERSEPARLRYEAVRTQRVLRNRSFAAFEKNPEAAEILEANAGLSDCEPLQFPPDDDRQPEPQACRAVDPVLRLLRLDAADTRDGRARTIAIAAFLAVHPTVIAAESSLYGGDLFGAVALTAERRLASGRVEDHGAVVAMFNGAEGDVSATWRRQGREDLLTLTDTVSSLIVGQSSPSSHPRIDAPADGARRISRDVTGPISLAFAERELRGRSFELEPQHTVRTATLAMPGRATPAGAEDGRSDRLRWFWKEPNPGLSYGAHGAKVGALNFVTIAGVTIPPLWLTRPAMLVAAPESRVSLSIYKVGPIYLASLPGEVTTVLGRRIRRGIAANRGANPDDVVLVGLAQSYAYYFTTPEEYQAQHYEGSGTLYGHHAGALIEHDIVALAGEISGEPIEHRRFDRRFRVWSKKSFGPDFIVEPATRVDSGLLAAMASDRENPTLASWLRWCWLDGIVGLAVRERGDSFTTARVTPNVSIQRRTESGWQQLVTRHGPVDDTGLEIVTVAGPPSDSSSSWCAYWLPSAEIDRNGTYRFAVEPVVVTGVCDGGFEGLCSDGCRLSDACSTESPTSH